MLKKYLRGLGIGICTTGLLLTIVNATDRTSMSNEEIMERAKQLGMVEGKQVLAETSDKTKEKGADEQEALGKEDESGKEKEAEQDQEQDDIDDDAGKENEEHQDNADEGKQDGVTEEIVITIKSGDGSLSIAKKLEKAELITDAAKYDRYLCEKGYDKRLVTGDHPIPIGATEEEIANILCEK